MAQFKIGFMYYQGRGVPQDYREAVKWTLLSAEHGEPNAQGLLGLMYLNGKA